MFRFLLSSRGARGLRPWSILLSAFLFLAALAPQASAQFAPTPIYSYENPYVLPEYPPANGRYASGNALSGAADVIHAQGDLLLQQQQARILSEHANQLALLTRKQSVDETNYERANTPTYNDALEWAQAQNVRQMLNTPTDADVTSGAAQNTLLTFLSRLMARGLPTPPVYVDPAALAQINVMVGNGGNLGLLRDHGKVAWPLALQGPVQEQLDVLLPKAVSDTIHGTLSLAHYQELRTDVAELRADLDDRAADNAVDASSRLIAEHFLNDLDSAVVALQQPNAGKILDGTYTAQGATVAMLVQNMTAQGLRFAPALPGQESAYASVENALASYAADAACRQCAGCRPGRHCGEPQ